MSEQKRRLNIEVNLDTSKLEGQATSATRKVGGILSSIKDDKGALAEAKAKVDQLVASVSASGSKLSIPMEQFRAAVQTTSAALDKMGADNAARLEALYPKYDQLKQKMMAAWNSGNNTGFAAYQQQVQQVEREIAARERLDKQIRAQWEALDQLNSKVQQHAAASKTDENNTQALAQKLAECKKRMQELAADGQQNSKEFQEQSVKAKELAEAMQQVNADANPDAHARLRTALMNAKQAMAETEKEFGRGSVQFQQARDEAIRLQQAMNGINKQVKNMAAPNDVYQGIINGINGISGAASAATGMIALFGGENQRTAEAMAKLQAIMSITMGLQSMSMMLNKNSAVQLNIIGRLTTWWAACKAKAAAATATETAATVTNTTAQTAQTAAVTAGTTANVAHAASWKAVGIAIKSVPVFGWIITGITALVGVIALLTRKTREQIQAEEERKKQIERQKEIEKNFHDAVAQSASASIAKYMELKEQWEGLGESLRAKEKFINSHKDAFRQLGVEIKNVGDAQKYLCEQTDLAIKALSKQAVSEAFSAQLSEALKPYTEAWEKNRTYTTAPTIGKRVRYIASGSHNGIGTDEYSGITREEFWLIKDKLRREYTMPSAAGGGSFDSYYMTDEAYRALNDIRNKKAFDAQEDALEKMTKISEQYATAQQKQNQEIEQLYKKMGITQTDEDGDTPPGTNPNELVKFQYQLTEAELRAIRERNRQFLQLAFEREQAEIDIMEDGASKRQRQRELDARRENEQLQQQFEDQIQAEVNRAKTLFDAQERVKKAQADAKGQIYNTKFFNMGELLSGNLNTSMTSDQIEQLDMGDLTDADKNRIKAIIAFYSLASNTLRHSQQKRVEQEQAAERLAMEEYLKEYGTYEEKKTAIAAIYAEKRAKATTDAERMTLMQEEKAALDGLDFEDFVTNRVALAFGEVENLTQSTITSLIAELEKHRDKVTQTFDPDKIEKFNKALADLKRAQAMGEGNIFQQFLTPDFLKERKAAQSEIDNAEKTHNSLLDAKIAKEEEVEKKIEGIIAKVKELTGQELTAAQVTDGSTVNNIIGQLGQPGGNQQGATDLSGLLNNLGQARVELGQVTTASNTAGNKLGQLKEAFTAKFTGQGGALAMVDAIVHGINDIVQGANETVKELASTADALGADTSIGSGWDKAQTFMQGFADASAGATEAFDSLKSGNIMGVVSGVTKSFTSWIKAFAAMHDASRERTIQRLQDEIDELERLNRRIEHQLESQYSKQAAKSYDEEIRNLEKQRELIQQQIAAEEDKKNTDDDRIKEWEDQYEELGWQIEEYKDKALDAILGEDISTSIDNFADALADSWGKTGDRARATKDYVKSILRQMVLEAMKTDLTTPIRKLREMMTKALDDNVVTEAEQKELEAFAQQLANETEAKYKWADNIINGSNSSQSGATTGTFATASQDSITELSGRAAAIHTSGEMRRELLMTISLDLQEMRSRIAASKENETEIRNLVFLAVGHLETIARNTNELYEMNERLDKIEKNTRGL